MCGGIVYNLERIPLSELNKFYSEKQIALFKKKGLISSFFWDKHAILPAKIDGKISLFEWGNRDKTNDKLPQTGWAKEESISAKRWDWLHPKKVSIPAKMGYEKGKWFEFDSDIQGILIEKNNKKHIYMVTKPADKTYLSQTKHDRMPYAEIKNYINKIKPNDPKKS